ncbi:hypothetical protein [Nocardia crassostreae]|uniref:hypothetical protein n=1 Tax=Nocardia crassostreae TaxID=53428 RepID=UPI000A9B5130|nr:hypothetical protein [Nocardia crassostreae]
MTTVPILPRRWTIDDIPDQSGKTAIVTGANSGLGLRTAEAWPPRAPASCSPAATN